MKPFKHIAYLLERGKKPKEIVELGFSKRVVTRVFRKLRAEKRALGQEGEKSLPQPNEALPVDMTTSPPEIASLKDQIQRLEVRMEALERLGIELKVLSADLNDLGAELEEKGAELEKVQTGIIAGPTVVILKPNLICDCGEADRIAVHLKCLNCEKEHWWYWSPKE